MSEEDKSWRILVCVECPAGPLYRPTRYVSAPEGARTIGPGAVHHARTHQVFADRAAYRRATGPGSHDPCTDDHKDPAESGLSQDTEGVWRVA